MSKQYQKIYYLIGSLFCVIILGYVYKYFSLVWVETTINGAKVNINFLLPIEQANFDKHLQFEFEGGSEEHLEYNIEWIDAHVVQIAVRETSEVKGKKAYLKVCQAPILHSSIKKNILIPIQFKTEVKLLSPRECLVSSTQPFTVSFNTPIALSEVKKNLFCESQFKIEVSHGEKNTQQEDTTFIFTPISPLQNAQDYELIFKSGMLSTSGIRLKDNQIITLHVDQKPNITKTYPINGDKWIGLYPHIMLETKEPIVKAEMYLNHQLVEGALINSRQAHFVLDDLLEPKTQYTIGFRVYAASGEMSHLKEVIFSTTSIDHQRIWLDIHLNRQEILCYEGNRCIRKIPCIAGDKLNSVLLGTYYLQGKSEVYEDATHKLGGNYWLIISEQLGIQGALRDAYWQLSQRINDSKNIIISDEDAAWLFTTLGEETMIIVRK